MKGDLKFGLLATILLGGTVAFHMGEGDSAPASGAGESSAPANPATQPVFSRSTLPAGNLPAANKPGTDSVVESGANSAVIRADNGSDDGSEQDKSDQKERTRPSNTNSEALSNIFPDGYNMPTELTTEQANGGQGVDASPPVPDALELPKPSAILGDSSLAELPETVEPDIDTSSTASDSLDNDSGHRPSSGLVEMPAVVGLPGIPSLPTEADSLPTDEKNTEEDTKSIGDPFASFVPPTLNGRTEQSDHASDSTMAPADGAPPATAGSEIALLEPNPFPSPKPPSLGMDDVTGNSPPAGPASSNDASDLAVPPVPLSMSSTSEPTLPGQPAATAGQFDLPNQEEPPATVSPPEDTALTVPPPIAALPSVSSSEESAGQPKEGISIPRAVARSRRLGQESDVMRGPTDAGGSAPRVRSYEIRSDTAFGQRGMGVAATTPGTNAPVHPFFQRYLDRKEYFSRQGDTLANIAQRLYGNEAMAKSLLAANRDKLVQAEDLRPGMLLRLP